VSESVVIAPRNPVVVAVDIPTETSANSVVNVTPAETVTVAVSTPPSSFSVNTGNPVEVVVSDIATPYEFPTQTLTDMESVPGAVFVGIAAVGALTSAAVWRIYKIVEADEYPVKVPENGLGYDNIWDDRASILYQTG
jgi:hypothetical protein